MRPNPTHATPNPVQRYGRIVGSAQGSLGGITKTAGCRGTRVRANKGRVATISLKRGRTRCINGRVILAGAISGWTAEPNMTPRVSLYLYMDALIGLVVAAEAKAWCRLCALIDHK